MTLRHRMLLAAALLAPLLLVPLLQRPAAALAVAGAAAVVTWGSRSVAWPLALGGLSTVAVALAGSDPLPRGGFTAIVFAWTALAIARVLGREESSVTARVLLTVPVLLSLVLVAWMLWRLGASPVPGYGGEKLRLFLAANVTMLVAGVIVARRSSDFDLFVVLGLLVATLGAVVVIVKFLSGGAQVELPGRYALSAQENPITLGRQSASGLLLAAYVLLAARPGWLRTTALAALPILAAALFASGSRGPFLGLCAGALAFFGFVSLEASTRRRLPLIAVGIVAATVLISQLLPGAPIARTLSVITGSEGGLSSNGRSELWSSASGAFQAHPLVGLGPGGFASLAPDELYPHNIVLETAAELGLVGLVLLGGILVSAVGALLRAWRSLVGTERLRAALATGLFTSALVNALVSGDLSTNSDLWMTSGLAAGLGIAATR